MLITNKFKELKEIKKLNHNLTSQTIRNHLHTIADQRPWCRVVLMFLALCILGSLFLPGLVLAWPTDGEWISVKRNGIPVQDSNTDSSGSRNLVSQLPDGGAYFFNNGTTLFFRLRLDKDPTGTGGQGFLQAFGWGFEIDTNLDATNYEWLILLDGIDKTEKILLQENTITGTINDPGDNAEELRASWILSTANHRVVAANTAINGDQDYFLDFLIPFAAFKSATGLSNNSPIRFFEGSSPSARSLTDSGGDLMGASDLISGFSDYITPFGTAPTTATVTFVEDAAGNGDDTVYQAGDTLYVRVADGDENINATTRQTVSARLTSPAGDSEVVILTETGVNTGVFTGSLTTANAAVTSSDGTLQVQSGETITVTYIDAIDAGNHKNQQRSDTIGTGIVTPDMSVNKSVTPPSTDSGGTVRYTVTVSNSGSGEGQMISLQDNLPGGFSYVTGSTTGLTTNDPAVVGQQLSWTGTWSVPAKGSRTLSFDATAATVSGTHTNQVSINGSNFDLILSSDTAPVTVRAPLMEITKSVSNSSANPGDEVIYTLHYHNTGDSTAHNLVFFDPVPTYTTFISGSLRAGAADSTFATATILLSDDPTDDQGAVDGGIDNRKISFTVDKAAANDAAAGTGNDEGKLYFKVTVD